MIIVDSNEPDEYYRALVERGLHLNQNINLRLDNFSNQHVLANTG
ncbi:MAG: hypothetical protein QXX35_01885 [Desulfurococcaceae archaeon]